MEERVSKVVAVRSGSARRPIASPAAHRPAAMVALVCVLACGSAETEVPSRDDAGSRPITLVPAPRHDALFLQRHESMRAQPERARVELVFLGDSILRRFETEGRESWNDHYAGRRVANFAIEGDRTQNVLWRIDDGLFDGMAPRLIVIGIGTNNTAESGANEIALGVAAIVARLRARVPDAELLVLGLLPRGTWRAGDPLRARVEETNARLAAFAAERRVAYLDLGRRFLRADGGLDRSRLPDGLHPGADGYRALAEGLEAELTRILGEPLDVDGMKGSSTSSTGGAAAPIGTPRPC